MNTISKIQGGHFRAIYLDFCSFDDPDGYNEMMSPDPTTIMRFFNGYINDHKEEMLRYLDNIRPFPVISIDGTFDVRKRTKV